MDMDEADLATPAQQKAQQCDPHPDTREASFPVERQPRFPQPVDGNAIKDLKLWQ